MWPFSQPKCPVCAGALIPHSGTIGYATYRCPTCIKRNSTKEEDR